MMFSLAFSMARVLVWHSYISPCQNTMSMMSRHRSRELESDSLFLVGTEMRELCLALWWNKKSTTCRVTERRNHWWNIKTAIFSVKLFVTSCTIQSMSSRKWYTRYQVSLCPVNLRQSSMKLFVQTSVAEISSFWPLNISLHNCTILKNTASLNPVELKMMINIYGIPFEIFWKAALMSEPTLDAATHGTTSTSLSRNTWCGEQGTSSSQFAVSMKWLRTFCIRLSLYNTSGT